MAHEASLEGADREQIGQFVQQQMEKIIDDLSHSGEETEVAMEDDQQGSLLFEKRNRSGVSSDESSTATQHYSSLKDKQSHESNLREASTSNQQDTTEHS